MKLDIMRGELVFNWIELGFRYYEGVIKMIYAFNLKNPDDTCCLDLPF